MGGATMECSKVAAREKLFNKLGMTEQSLKSDAQHLKMWMSKQLHLNYGSHLNLDEWLENQLIMSKNSLEKAKNSIERYFAARIICPHLFVKRDVLHESLCQSFENLTISYLPGLTPRLHKLCIVRLENSSVEHFNFEAHMKRCLMVMEYYLKEGLDFTGFHIIFDLKNFRLNHLSMLNLSLLKSMSISMKAYPVSFTVINLINYPTFVEKAIAVFKPFISSKLLTRIILIKDINCLKDEIGDVELPIEYSGSNFTQKENSDKMKSNLQNIRDYILLCDKAQPDLNQQLLKRRCSSSEIEMKGSFRMLSID